MNGQDFPTVLLLLLALYIPGVVLARQALSHPEFFRSRAWESWRRTYVSLTIVAAVLSLVDRWTGPSGARIVMGLLGLACIGLFFWIMIVYMG